MGRSKTTREAPRETVQPPLRAYLKLLQEGHAPAMALEFVAERAQAPLKQAFREHANQLKLGRPLVAVLDDIATAYPAADNDLIMAAIEAHQQMGKLPATVNELLRDIEDSEGKIREDMEFLVGPGRRWALGLVWAAILLAAVLLIAIPQYTQTLLGTASGRAVFCFAILLDVLGFMWAAAILRLQSGVETQLKSR